MSRPLSVKLTVATVTDLVFAWIRDAKIFADFLDKGVLDFRMSRNSGVFPCVFVDEKAVSSTFAG